MEALIVYFEEIFESSAESVCVTKKNFTKEVSIDQAVARAESFKPGPGPPERRMQRSISCVSNLKIAGVDGDRSRPSLFQSRGVHLRRDRSLTADNATRHRQVK